MADVAGRKWVPAGRAVRWAVRLSAAAAAAGLLWPGRTWPGAAKYVAGASPLVAVASSIAARAVGSAAIGGLVFIVACILRRRWFCRFVCPVGLLLEAPTRLGRRRGAWWVKCPPLGRYLAGLILAGALVGYPLLLWADPLAMLSGALNSPAAGSLWAGVFAAGPLAAVVVLALPAGGLWCGRLCPLGGTQDLLALCRPQRAPAGAGEDQTPRTNLAIGRRAFLTAAAGAALGAVARQAAAEDPPIRPPGAAEEDRFSGLCIRCGNCMEACPAGIITADLGQAGLAGLLAPKLRFDKDYCREDCTACTHACPSGALVPLDLPAKAARPIGLARLDESICLMVLHDGECAACLHCCPTDAIRTAFDERRYVSRPAIDPARCNGCGACEAICPTRPARAVRVTGR